MKYPFALIILTVVSAPSLNAAIYASSPDADSFVRATAPTSNYGGAGALSVSGASATNSLGTANGVFDTFIRFNVAGMVSNFNSLYGSNNWVINGVTLQLTETTSAGNNIFNRGVGAFQIRWIANDTWTEGTGVANTPTSTGITYNSEPGLLNAAVDANLGTFTNTGLSQLENFSLNLPSGFVSDLQAGGETTVFLTATDPNIGFTFNSRSFGTVAARPALNISAVPRPGIATVALAGTSVVISGNNGVAGQTYHVLSGTNATVPLNQWLPVSTNVLNISGNFTITLTNAGGAQQKYFILQTK